METIVTIMAQVDDEAGMGFDALVKNYPILNNQLLGLPVIDISNGGAPNGCSQRGYMK